MIAEQAVNRAWRDEVATWIVDSGCLYFIAWGIACQEWHDVVDWTVLEAFDFGQIPDYKFVMTTWHEKESLSEALWFAANCAFHPDVELTDTVIVHISSAKRCDAMLELFRKSQETVQET